MRFAPFLFKSIDNAQLIVFRVFFGLLVCAESFGALATGWVRRVFIEPQFTFSFIGFEWLQPLPGNGMYFYFAVMGILGIFITLGYKYRITSLAFAILWSGVYLMQKTSYNNHYYLFALLAYIMAFLPANRDVSLDAKFNPSLRKHGMYNYIRWIIIVQLFIVYTYASLAKLYNDWLDLSFIEVLMRSKKEYFLIGGLLQEKWVQVSISTFGIIFDLLIIPALLWKPSRKIAFGCAIFFHLFNSFVFGIGIFPYLALAFTVFFFEPQTVRNIFMKKKKVEVAQRSYPTYAKPILLVGGIYFLIQAILPVRHNFIKGNVLWTEEGHRLSWRMMLRSRSGYVKFKVVDKKTNEEFFIDLDDYLTKKQQRRIGSYPDFIWQFAQRLKKEYQEKGMDIGVYALGKARVNKGDYYTIINPQADLASEKWKHFSHNDWILLPEEYQ